MKVCSSCLKEKNLEDFYKAKTGRDGRAGTCKDCQKSQVKERYKTITSTEEGKAQYRKGKLNYYHTGSAKKDKVLKTAKTIKREYYDNYPEKMKAKIACNLLPKRKGYHLHHWSYNEEHFLDTITLPASDHITAHRFMVYDQERRMYRKITGELLDTKQAHEKHIFSFINQKS